MALVGRDSELAAVARALDAVPGGAARALGVIGEAGIGKTALLAAIAGQARLGMRVVAGCGAEHEQDVPFGVAAAALEPHLASLHPTRLAAVGADLGSVVPTAGAGPAERFRLHRALRGMLELLGRERPLALMLDDLHWADEASVELVLHLLRRPLDVPHLLVFALRDVGPAARLLDAARSLPGFEQLALDPLDEEASQALLAGIGDRATRERVARDAAGNPLFLRELARAAGRPGVPRTVLAAVELELAALAPASRALVAGAAVLGDAFAPELAAAAADLEPDAGVLDGLVASGLVRSADAGRTFAFRHPLVRRAVYEAAPPAWRLDAHERAAAALLRRGAPPTMLADHVARSARPGDGQAVGLLVAAAASAAAPARAAGWYAAALALLPYDDAQRAKLLGPLAVALADAGRLKESHAALVEVLDIGVPAGARLELVRACARVEQQLGRQHEARRRLTSAIRDASAAGQAAIAFELAADAMTRGRSADLRAWADRARRLAEGVDSVVHAGAATLRTLGSVWAGDPPVDTWRVDEHAGARPGGLVHVGRAQLRLGRFADAEATTTIALADGPAQEPLRVWLRVVRAWARVLLLELDGALEDVEAAEDIAHVRDVPHARLLVLCKRMLVHHHRGEALDAERAAVECAAIGAGLERSPFTAHAACHAAEVRAAQDPERCIRELTAAAGPELEATDPSMSSATRLLLVRVAVAAGRIDDAERWARRAEERAARLRLPVAGVRAVCGSAEVLLARGAAIDAAERALRAAADADATAPLDAAEARLLAGRALAAAGDPAGAGELLQRVAADADRAGAMRLRQAAARELRRIGSRVSAGRGESARRVPLTERERRIAELVTHGRSNKQIAATLFLSEKTVANSLTRVYAKVGVRSRVDLTRELAG